VSVRALLDHSVLELFLNGRPLTARSYPTSREALQTAVEVPTEAAGRPDALAVTVGRFAAWRMEGAARAGDRRG